MSSKVKKLFELDDVPGSRDEFEFKEEFGCMPTSVMTFNKSKELMSYLEEDESSSFKVGHQAKAKLSGQDVRYSVFIPDAAEFLIKYYTSEGDTILDPFMGRGTRSTMSLKNKRKYVGYDIDQETVDLNLRLCNRNKFNESDYKLICGDGTEFEEYKDKENFFDHILTCPPYYNIEKYSGAEGDISYLNDNDFENKIKNMFKHCYRLLKPSTYDVDEKNEDVNKRADMHLLIITVGSKRNGKYGYQDMDYVFQKLAKEAGFILWDKQITINRSPFIAFTFRRNYKKRFVSKTHETTLVFAKFDK